MMLKRMYQINDIIDTETGIFKALQLKASPLLTWLTNDNYATLDLEYYINHSGYKYISPLVDRLYTKDATTYLSKIADVFILRYGDNLKKIYDALNTTYKPLENYSMVEDENVGSEIVMDADTDNNVYGFNTTATNGVPNSKNTNKTTTTGDYDKNKKHLTRSGNIGVTTSQQMLESELNLRRYQFYQYVYKCVDSIMCLDVR